MGFYKKEYIKTTETVTAKPKTVEENINSVGRAVDKHIIQPVKKVFRKK